MRPHPISPALEPATDRGPCRLTEVPSGVAARLYRRDLSYGECCLLAAMGLGEGCRLVVRSHGDPCIVEVRSTRIGLARTVAERLYVLAELDGAR
jgi:Fe2+ transport system protein FeoA